MNVDYIATTSTPAIPDTLQLKLLIIFVLLLQMDVCRELLAENSMLADKHTTTMVLVWLTFYLP
jgi:hypothetical protein